MGDKYDCLKISNQLCFPLYACSKEIVKRYKPYLDPLDLTYTQYITMMVVWEEKELTVKALGDKLFLDSGTLTPVLDGVNQESVFSVINWDTETFSASDAEDREYFLNYLATVKADGKEVYLLEYTKDPKLISTIKKQSAAYGYHYYISDSIELD